MNHRSFVTFLTLARAPLVLLGCLAALLQGLRFQNSVPLLVVAVAMLGASAITDMFDGKLARKWHVTSRFGALADPLMDKFFYAVSLPCATFLAARSGDWTHAGLLLALDVVSMLRDQWVTFLRAVGSAYGADCRANWFGKFRTAMSFPIICAVYLYLGLLAMGALGAGAAAVLRHVLYALEALQIGVTLVTADAYTRQYMPYMRRSMSDK